MMQSSIDLLRIDVAYYRIFIVWNTCNYQDPRIYEQEKKNR